MRRGFEISLQTSRVVRPFRSSIGSLSNRRSMARDVLGNTRRIVLGVMRREEWSMRFPMLVLATAIAALACEKGAPLSNSTANLEPAPAATPVAAAPIHASPIQAVPTHAAPQAGTEAKAGTQAPALAPSGVAPSGVTVAVTPAATRDAIPPSAAPPQPSAASEEGNGEPMDDVDDEEVSATDKSGAGAVTHEEAADDGPSGPVDDSEGADIELREWALGWFASPAGLLPALDEALTLANVTRRR
jgi:hypothetical protein